MRVGEEDVAIVNLVKPGPKMNSGAASTLLKYPGKSGPDHCWPEVKNNTFKRMLVIY